MKKQGEVHILGKNFHQGLQELTKDIKRATKLWDHRHGAVLSEERPEKVVEIRNQSLHAGDCEKFMSSDGRTFADDMILNHNFMLVTGDPTAVSNGHSNDLFLSSVSSVTERTDDPARSLRAISSIETELKDDGVKPPMEFKENIGSTDAAVNDKESYISANVKRDWKIDKTAQSGRPVAADIRSMEIGEVSATEVASTSPCKTIRHKIRLCSRNHKELVSQSELDEKIRTLQKSILILNYSRLFKFWLSSNQPLLIMVCREEDFFESYTVFMEFTASMGIRHYFPTISGKGKTVELTGQFVREQKKGESFLACITSEQLTSSELLY